MRRVFLRDAESETISAIMSAAPCSASSIVEISFSGFTKGKANSCGEREAGSWAKIAWASGSSPFSRATEARVRRLGRKGRYRSSTSAKVAAEKIACLKESSILP